MKKIIVANWKMNPTAVKEAEKISRDIVKYSPKLKNAEIVICPPFIYLDRLSKQNIKLGGQDVFWEGRGAFTGEISPAMLKDIGAKYVIIGHSERRQKLDETGEMINKKIKAALKSGLKVIFCVGEKERDEAGEYLKFIKNEIQEGLAGVSKKDSKNLIIAYEPIWAISSNKGSRPDTPEEFLQTAIYIRRILFFKFGSKTAHNTPILYGGSVDASNAGDFVNIGNAQGLLVGRASLNAQTFADILKNI